MGPYKEAFEVHFYGNTNHDPSVLTMKILNKSCVLESSLCVLMLLISCLYIK